MASGSRQPAAVKLSTDEHDRLNRKQEHVAHLGSPAGFAGRMLGEFHEIGADPVEGADDRPPVRQPNLHCRAVAYQPTERDAECQPGLHDALRARHRSRTAEARQLNDGPERHESFPSGAFVEQQPV